MNVDNKINSKLIVLSLSFEDQIELKRMNHNPNEGAIFTQKGTCSVRQLCHHFVRGKRFLISTSLTRNLPLSHPSFLPNPDLERPLLEHSSSSYSQLRMQEEEVEEEDYSGVDRGRDLDPERLLHLQESLERRWYVVRWLSSNLELDHPHGGRYYQYLG